LQSTITINKEQLAIIKKIFQIKKFFILLDACKDMPKYLYMKSNFPDLCNLCPQSPDSEKTNYRLEWSTLLKLKDLIGVEMGLVSRKDFKR
jgi:hypothetical protein